MNAKSCSPVDYMRLQDWRGKLIWGGDRVSQRLIGHALESGWCLQKLARMLHLSDEELGTRWATGQGLVDVPRVTMRSAAAVLQLSPWQFLFLSGELALADLVPSSSRSDLLARARARWPVLGDAPESVALLALVLSGDLLVAPATWRNLVDGAGAG